MKDDRDGGDVDGRRMARVQNGISKQQTQWAWAWHRMRIKNVGGKRQKVYNERTCCGWLVAYGSWAHAACGFAWEMKTSKNTHCSLLQPQRTRTNRSHSHRRTQSE